MPQMKSLNDIKTKKTKEVEWNRKKKLKRNIKERYHHWKMRERKGKRQEKNREFKRKKRMKRLKKGNYRKK